MDFIERLFAVSPDGGSGATELLYIAIPLVVVALHRWRATIGAIIKRRTEG